MEAKELRIKNKILNDGCICDVLKIYGGTYNYCTLKTKQGGEINARYELLKPIPLTEEWLLRFGFVKQTNNSKYWSKNNVDIDLNEWFGFNNMVAKIPLKYVHQLQNLYFALTGQELEIIS